MGIDPKKSVLDRFNQVHDVKNVFVTDGAVFVTQGCYEPTLTIMAISARAADHIVEEFRKGNLCNPQGRRRLGKSWSKIK